jgi:predicted DNA-binding transcriptional regulator AlpA
MRQDNHLCDTDPDAVLTFQEWCLLNGLSHDSGHRLRRSGEGPRFIRISERRVGVTRRENRRWQESRPTAA